MTSLLSIALSIAVSVVLLAPAAFAAGRELAPRPLIPNSDFTVDIEVASAGNRFLTVWEVSHGRKRGIYGSLSDANGHRISPSAIFIAEASRSRDGAIAVTGTGDAFAVFWIDGAHAVHLTDVSLDGQILGTRTLALPTADHVSVAWNGERFMVALAGERYSIDRGEGALLARDGTVLHGGIPLELNALCSVAATEDGFLVFTSGRVYVHAVASDGSVTKRIAGDPGGNFVSAPLTDGRLLLVYTLSDGQLSSSVWKDGAKLTDTIIDVKRNMAPVGILRGEDRHLLAFTVAGETLYTVELNDDGTLASEPVSAGPDFRNARGASNDQVLLVPHRYQSVPVTPPSVVSVVIRRDHTVSAKEAQSIRPAPQSHVLVGAGGGSMIGVWNEATADGGSRIRSARIDRNFESAEVHEVAPDGVLVARTLAWNGTSYLVLYRTSHHLLAARVAYDGAPIGEPRVLAETYDNRAAVTWAGDRWAVAWTELYGNIIRYATVSYGGIPSLLEELELTRNQIVDLALAFDGTRVHLGWIESQSPHFFEPPPPGHAVFTTRLRRNGRVADAQPLAIPASSPQKLAMAASGARVVLLVDEDMRTTANVIEASPRQLAATHTLFDTYAYSDVTWDGSEFVAAVSNRTGEQSYAEVWNLGEDGTAADEVRVTATLAGDRHLSIASSPGYDAVLGLQDSDAASGQRAVIYPAREMFRLPVTP